jgi:serine protease Do
VTTDGSVITNAHVVEKCSRIAILAEDSRTYADVLVKQDLTNDLALLHSDAKPTSVARLKNSVRLGEPVAAFGFPLSGLLSTGGNFTLGNVTSLAGIADDSRNIQISTPVQPGNSGGPLLDQMGNVVGIVTSKLNALKIAGVFQ